MKINVCSENADRIEKKLADCLYDGLAHYERGGTAHAFHGFDEIADLCDRAEHRLNTLGLAAYKRKGAVLRAMSGSKLEYPYGRIRTIVRAERGTKDWFLTDVVCMRRRTKNKGELSLFLTVEQDMILVTELRKAYEIRKVGT